jgi:ankyrin repeat protein
VAHVPDTLNARDAFITAAVAPRTASHASGTLDDANAFLAADPSLKTYDIHTAAILGDDAAVRAFLTADPALATSKAPPYDWDALTHLCFSRYLRLDAARSDGFVNAARALLDAGADANTGFYEMDHQPAPEYEPVLYGAAGIAHHEGMTRLLLDRGADPNSEEVPYHAPEGYEIGAYRALIESDKLTADSLTTMLLRKSDWHDLDGMRLTLERGADANAMGRWGSTPLAHAIRSDNRASIVELLLDHGADALRVNRGRTPVAMAAWAGRNDLLTLFGKRGAPVSTLDGLDALIAACALHDAAAVERLTKATPELAAELRAHGAMLLARFAGNSNGAGIALLLDLGVPVNAPEPHGEGYLGRARNSTALHVAAFRGHHEIVRMLIAHGADVNVRNASNESPLMIAVNVNIDSYWVDNQSTESVAALLSAGASLTGVRYPSGYEAADALLRAHGAS